MQSITYNTYQYTLICTILANTHRYMPKQTNTYQCINTDKYLLIHTIFTVHTIWYKYILISINIDHYIQYILAVWWMRVVSTHSCTQFRHSKKNSNSLQFIELYSGASEQIKPLQPFGLSSSSSSSPCLTSGNHSRRLFQRTIEGFDCKINGQALGAALQHSLGVRAGTQGVSKSAAVAAGSNWLAWGKRATNLAILTQFDS